MTDLEAAEILEVLREIPPGEVAVLRRDDLAALVARAEYAEQRLNELTTALSQPPDPEAARYFAEVADAIRAGTRH